MRRLLLPLGLCFSLFFVVVQTGCNKSGSGGGGDEGGEGDLCPELNVDISVCDPEAGPFSLIIDNGFFPLVVGSLTVLEGEDDEGVLIRVEQTVLDETEEVAGVTTRVLESMEFEDDELIEVSRNFFVQAPDGTVCYFGEDVDNIEDGMVINNDGAWRAGVDGNLPGIIMPADPAPGMVFAQESAPGIAEDQAEVISLGDEVDLPAGMFDDTLTTEDCNPLSDDSLDLKIYVDGIGLAVDEVAELIEF